MIVRPALRAMSVGAQARLVDAMRAINRGGRGIAFVCDRNHRVIGTLTDGDIRRALLDGAGLESRCLKHAMRRDFTSVGPDEARADVVDMMRARDITQVPILDPEARLIGLHRLRELLGAVERENWAVIMAGGQGMRLRPLTERVPKPMLTIAGRPMLERLVLHLVGWGIRNVFMSVNYLSDVIEEHFGDGSRFGCRIQYLREKKPLGTGGALSLLPHRPKLPLLVVNGDLFTQVNIERLLARHTHGRYVATFGVRTFATEVPYGVMEVRNGRVIGLREKPRQEMLVNAGIYVLSARALRLIPRDRQFPMTELVECCVRRGLRVGAYLVEEEWFDVGRPDDLRKARQGV